MGAAERAVLLDGWREALSRTLTARRNPGGPFAGA
jgi:hypothetical protein